MTLGTTFILAGAALVLVVGVLVLATVNPYAMLGLAPALLAIAAIVRAIGGGKR